MIKINKDWKFKEIFPKMEGYTYTLNCIENNYPFEESIRSWAWLDRITVVDAGSTDGTLERLEKLRQEFPHIDLIEVPMDNEDPGRDGAMKAVARAMTVHEIVIPFDCDEFCGGHPDLWKRKAKNLNPNIDILNLFVLEPIGSENNLRLNKEHNIWKWRITRNKPALTHGISDKNRKEINGKIHSNGSDGCELIHISTNQMWSSLVDENIHSLMDLKYLINYDSGDDLENLKKEYVAEVKRVMAEEPYVYHVGHIDLSKKIKLYLNSWHKWWCFLYGKDPQDPQNNQYFPGVLPNMVTEEMINDKISEIIKNTPSVLLSNDSDVTEEAAE